jgi:hypothetical protein
MKYWEYHGSIAGVICNGPVDTLDEIIVDGETLWAGPLNRGSATNYSTITIDARRVIRFYWGTDTQTADPILQAGGNGYGHAHPDYKGICYLVLVDFYFGRERTSAPNIEVVVRRKPQQAFIAGQAAELADKEANPLACLAEWYLAARYGLGIGSGILHGASWQSAANALLARHSEAYASPLMNQQSAARSPVADLALIADIWLRFNPESEKIEAGTWPHTTAIDVSSLPLLTADDLTERPRFEGKGWGEMETGWAVTFTDRDRGFKESTEKHDDLRALRIVGDHRRETLKRPWIMRREQAFFHVTEYGKFKGQPAPTGQLTVRRTKALVTRPGDLIRVDIDPEPGGVQVQQVFRVTERTLTPTGPVRLRITAEAGISPVIYTPAADLPDTPQQTEPPAIANARIFELPAPLSGGGLAVGVLAERPADLVTGLNVFYDSSAGGLFQFLGTQDTFALRGAPSDEWTAASEGPFEVELYSTRDIGLIDDDPGDTAARDNKLLMVCLQREQNGAIAQDADGFAMLEIYSIRSFQQIGQETYQVSAYRGRFGTKKRAFGGGISECWIIPGFGLRAHRHRDFSVLQAVQQGGYFRLQPFTIFAQRDLADCANIPFAFSAALAYAPQVAFTEPATGSVQYGSPPGNVTFRGTVLDSDGNLTHFSLLRRAADGSEVTVFSIPLNPTSRYDFEQVVNFGSSGNFTVIARAQDATGQVADATVSIQIDQGAGKVATPVINPSVAFVRTTRQVTISCATDEATIEYVIVNNDDPAPGSGWSTYTGAFNVTGGQRVWARATKSGLTDSDLARADFFFDESFGEGNDPILP